jgi:hypothetical protein
MSSSGQKLITAKMVLLVLSLAVLLFHIPTPVYAQGLDFSLNLSYPEAFYQSDLAQTKGLSMAFPTAPLLERKPQLQKEVKIDYDLGWVELSTKAGNYEIGQDLVLDLPDYVSQVSASQTQEIWSSEQGKTMEVSEQSGRKDLLGFEIPVKFPKLISKIVGEGVPGLKVNGYKRISFAGRSQWQDGFTNTATSRQSKFPSLEMEQDSRFTITGTIGSNIIVKVDQDSKRMSDLENNIQLRYNGEEDEIIKSIELGNTSWSIPGLAGYSGTIKGLFGAKATAQVGGLDMTVVASQEKGSTEKVVFQAGAEVTPITIRDWDFLRWRYFYLGRSKDLDSSHTVNDFNKGDSIVDTSLAVFVNSSGKFANTDLFGYACVNPESTAEYPNEFYSGKFELVPDSTYRWGITQDSTNFWIKFSYSREEAAIVAVRYKKIPAGYPDSIIEVGHLPSNVPGDTAYLLKLIKAENPRPSFITWAYEWKNVYNLQGRDIDKEGFELRIYKGSGTDIEADKDYDSSGTRYITILGLDSLNLKNELIPDGLVDIVDTKINFHEGLLIFPTKKPFAYKGLDVKVPAIYDSSNSNDRRDASQYYIYSKSASRSTQYSLGRTNIIEGSEVVTLNGQRLTRGVDYNIIYEIGQITFTNDKVLDPTANLTIDYEYAPLFMLEKKTLFGLNTNYGMGNLKMGLSALYKSEKTGEDRPRVGQEPTRNFIWDGNLQFNLSPLVMTKLADALPLVETDAPSNLTFSAEVAQSLPNPNIKNDAFIDDFEGSLEYTDLGVRRGTWTLSSIPTGRDLIQRGRMTWYNPYDCYLIKDIWPNIETTTENDRINILVLRLDADSPHIPANGSFDPSAKVWNGVMRALPLGSADQSKTEFLEIWLNGDKGKIHIDLGQVSEDIDNNGILDTEDSTRNGFKDGILQDDEDKGLDHWWDDEERSKLHDSLPDPSGDNWYYDPNVNKNDCSHINGTQGNASDPDRGRYPDTEDLNRNDVLDVSNNYFEFNIDLVSDAPTEVSGQNWKLYRIPLKGGGNYDAVGTPDWSDIRFARVWVEDCDSIRIASLQLVGNRWRSSGTALVKPDSSQTGDGGTFRIFVINTHENPEYSPPPGVAGEVDKNTGVRQKEQSLVLKYENLKPGYYGTAYRTLYRVEDYTNYKDIKMYVHGPDVHTPGDTAGLKFFFRLGTDSLNYYEYHTDLDSGWNERNYVAINFEEITGIKSYMLQEPPDSGGYGVTQGHYRIRGKPTLSAVKWFSMGVENDTSSTEAKSGEVWVDELRVTNVRKNPGWAIRSSVSANFADLLSVSLDLNKTDSEFHDLRTNRGSGVNSTGTSFSTSINLEKFLSPSWGLKLPFSYSWSKNLSVPRLKVGSDIVLPTEQRDQEKTESVNESFSFSPSFKKNTKNWITNWTLNRISTRMSYSKQKGRSPATPVLNSSNYQVAGGYDLTPPSKLSFSPLTWSKKVFLLNKLSQTKFYYLPTTLNFDGSVNRLKAYSLNDFGSATSVYTRDFDGGMNLAFSPFSNLPLSYTWRTNRDIRDDNQIKFSLNPSKMRLGIERTNRKSFNASYSPKIFSFLDHRFSFSSNYNENCDPLQFTDGTRSVTNDNTRSASFTLRWQKLLEKVSLEDKPKSASADKKEAKGEPLSWIRKKIGFLSKRINPLQGSVSRNKSFARSGLLDRPSFRYQLGFTDDPGVGMKPTTSGTVNDALTTRDNYDLRSGIAILSTNLDVGYSETITDTRNPNAHTENRSKTFPELSFGWNNINKFKFLNKYVSSLGFRFGYSRKVGTTNDKLVDATRSKNTSISFNPLASFSLVWKNGIRTNLGIDKSQNKNEDLGFQGGNRTTTVDSDQTITLNNSYSFRAPQGIKFPLLKKIKFESNLSLSLDINHRTHKQRKSTKDNPSNLIQHRTELTISPRAGYNLSSQVQAGLSGTWVDTNDKITRIKSHTRQLGIWFEIRF